MFNIELICVGKLGEDYLKQACGEYIKRLKSFCNIQVIEVSEGKIPSSPSAANIQSAVEREGEAILKHIQAGRGGSRYVMGMCIEGKMRKSESLAAKLQDIAADKSGRLTIIIGGSHGLSDGVKSACDELLSMSPMTFPHQLFRVMALEQLYRAFSINSGSKYHK